MKSRFAVLLLTAVLALSMIHSVSAHEVPDLSKSGTITFQVTWEGEPLEDGEFRMYRVGDIVENDGDFLFALVPELADSGVNLENTDDPALAQQLADLAADAGLEFLTAAVENGQAYFADVVPGLYVVVQTEACTGFAKMNPFLISMPRFEDGAYVMDVVAKPKVPMETEPTEPTDPTEPTTPPPPELPQTGQLNWPVPLLASAGLAFFALGWVLCFKRKRECDET